MKKALHRLLAFAAALTLALTAAAFPAHAASGGYISELRLAAGEDAMAQLENDGFTVVCQNLNVGTEGDERLYLGYKLGGTPITDIAVGFQCAASKVIGSANYMPVSDISLNRGVGGVPLYLYCTHDSSAGNPIVSLATLTCGGEDSSAVYPMLNDGSEAVRTETGEAADFDLGVPGAELYMMKIREGLCMPYIKDVSVVSAATEREALKNIVEAGCNYFIDENLSVRSDAYTYVCYNRTADPSDAVTMLAASTDGGAVVRNGVSMSRVPVAVDSSVNFFLYTSKDPAVGNPVTDITRGKLMGPRFTLGDWAMVYFGGSASSAQSQVYGEDFYYELLADTTECTEIPVDLYTEGSPAGQSPLRIITAKAGLDEKLPAGQNETSVQTEIIPAAENDSLLADGSARDEFNPLADEKTFDAPDAPDAPAYFAGTEEALAMMAVSGGDVSGSDISGTDVSGTDFAGSIFGRGGSGVFGFIPALTVLLAGCAVIGFIFKRNTAEQKESEKGEAKADAEE